MASETPTVLFVHAVDTEGPISETLQDTFERIDQLFDVKLKATRENLQKLQRMEIDLNGKEHEVADCVSPKRISFYENFSEIDRMLDRLFDPEFRKRLSDDFGNPYRLTWYCIDHVGYSENPRRRMLGYHTILKHYLHRLEISEDFGDTIQWHFHAVPFNQKANYFGLNWSFSNEHIKVLCRRLIDYGLFPSAFRPGGWIERPDMHMFLEQWIPLDFGNHSLQTRSSQPDYCDGRFMDWRRAPQDWNGYHPDYSDYQLPGEMKRMIFRSLSLDARAGSISEDDITQAFEAASPDLTPVLSVTNHDNRDMVEEISNFWELLQKVRKNFPQVKFQHVDEVTAARENMKIQPLAEFSLDAKLDGDRLTVVSNRKVWGSQPFLAVKTVSGDYYHDNFSFDGNNSWHYRFDEFTVPLGSVECIGIAAHDAYINTSIKRIYPER